MGNDLSADEEARRKYNKITEIYNQLHGSLPDVGIDASLQAYSGLDSNAVLQSHSNQLQHHLEMSSGTYIRAAASAFGGLSTIPNAVGIGALMISIFLELILASSRKPPQDVAGLLRRVFAEEKASEVRNLMDEYSKRYAMYLHNENLLFGETRRLEQQLSVQLTRLRNSMLREGQMSSRSLKHWANGAAFHAQMVIHVARLQRGSSAPARNVISAYQNDMTQLLSKYKEYRTSKHFVHSFIPGYFVRACPLSNRKKRQVVGFPDRTCVICDSETGWYYSVGFGIDSYNCGSTLAQKYTDYMFAVHEPIKKMERYFTELDYNLDSLVAQHGQFMLT